MGKDNSSGPTGEAFASPHLNIVGADEREAVVGARLALHVVCCIRPDVQRLQRQQQGMYVRVRVERAGVRGSATAMSRLDCTIAGTMISHPNVSATGARSTGAQRPQQAAKPHRPAAGWGGLGTGGNGRRRRQQRQRRRRRRRQQRWRRWCYDVAARHHAVHSDRGGQVGVGRHGAGGPGHFQPHHHLAIGAAHRHLRHASRGCMQLGSCFDGKAHSHPSHQCHMQAPSAYVPHWGPSRLHPKSCPQTCRTPRSHW